MFTLWLPIAVSTVALFVASFLSWMVVRLHEQDWRKLDGEEGVMDAIRVSGAAEGNYMFPGVQSAKQMNDPDYVARYNAGPRGVMTILPVPNMPLNLGLTVLYFLVCNVTFAYLADFAIGESNPEFITIFRFVATIGLLTFCASILQHAIWFKNRVVGHVIESVAYALIAGAIFAALWPAG